jgi:hypothetical protein
LGGVVSLVVLVAACDAGDDTVAPATTKDSGGGGGGDATVDGFAEGGADTATDPNSLCGKYGGFDQVLAMADRVIEVAKADCRIGAYFTALDKDPQTAQHHKECFRNYLGEMFQCGGITYAGSKGAGLPCQTLAEAHKNVDPRISQGDFQAFFVDATQALQAYGVSSDDLSKLGPMLNTTQGDVVQKQELVLDNSPCDGGPIEGGKEGGTEGGTDAGIPDAPGEGG